MVPYTRSSMKISNRGALPKIRKSGLTKKSMRKSPVAVPGIVALLSLLALVSSQTIFYKPTLVKTQERKNACPTR